MAAVDLGSNSFHMVVARAHHGHPAIVDRLREMVRLASGLSEHGYLDGASQSRALACLRRFGQRIRDMQAHQVRVVGTNTLRRARNADAFLSRGGGSARPSGRGDFRHGGGPADLPRRIAPYRHG